jgi:hypothetical protein
VIKLIRALVITLVYLASVRESATSASILFVKSQSGPSGKIVENHFIFDESRNRFVYPQDKTLTVYFEWEAPPGNHTLSAFWKDPIGRTSSISPDIKIETKTADLNAYWIFEVNPSDRSGIWTVDIRVDGEPAGSHSFELVIPEPPKTEVALAPPPLPSLDQIYASVQRSLVWIYKLDEAGRRTDTSLGFVIGRDRIATAFQSIDGTLKVEVEFADRHKTICEEVWACDRFQDWALLKVQTDQVPPLASIEGGSVPVGERYLVFNVEKEDIRVIGGVDITARRTVPGFGERIQLSPFPASEAAGGPLLNPNGMVVGIVGGSITPGSRFSRRAMSVSPGLWSKLNGETAATPITVLPAPNRFQPASFQSLLDRGVLTTPLKPTSSLLYGGSARSVAKRSNDLSTTDASEFSHRDQFAWIYTLWQKKDKIGKGVVSAKVYDSRNRLLVDVTPKRVSLPEGPPLRVAFDVPLEKFSPGVFRVDVLWNDQPAWRTFFTVTD